MVADVLLPALEKILFLCAWADLLGLITGLCFALTPLSCSSCGEEGNFGPASASSEKLVYILHGTPAAFCFDLTTHAS